MYLLTRVAAVAAFAIADAVRSESREAIQRLHGQGVEVAMLTGDTKAVADAVAEYLGIEMVFADMRPSDKVQKIDELKSRGRLIELSRASYRRMLQNLWWAAGYNPLDQNHRMLVSKTVNSS